MPLNKANCRVFHRTLYAGQLEVVTLRKRDDDQREGVVKALTLYEIRWSSITKAGEPLLGDVSSNHRRTIHIPRTELDRVGVHWINADDQFEDQQGRTWQPEAQTGIDVKLFEDHVCVECLRRDPHLVPGR